MRGQVLLVFATDEGKPEEVEAIHPTASSGYFNSHISEQQDRTNGTA